MSGIAGLVALKTPKQLNEGLLPLAKGLHPGEPEFAFTQFGAFGVVAAGRNPGLSPAVAQERDLVLCFLGRIAQDQHFAEKIQRIGREHQDRSLAEKLLLLYEQDGSTALQSLNGQYIVVIWNEARHVLEIINDRYGIMPFYYWKGNNELVFSSTVRAIARYPHFSCQGNPDALFDLLAAGQMLGDRTLLKEVQALPPAGRLTFQQGRLSISRYWKPALFQPGDRVLSSNYYINELTDALHLAVRRHTRPGSILLLTGGLDSRLLAGLTATLYGSESITAHTIGHPRARDVRLAKAIAGQLGLKHHIIPVNPHYISEYSEECILRSEGNMNCAAGWILGESQHLAPSGITSIITGVGAELISGRHWLAELGECDPEVALEALCREYWHFKPAADLLRPPYREAAQQASLDLLKQCLQDAPSDDPGSRYDYLHLVQHRRHPTGNILSIDALVDEPFFDIDLVDLALRIPPRRRSNLYMEVIMHAFPHLATIQTSERGLSIPKVLDGRQNHAWQVERFLTRVLHRLPSLDVFNLPHGDARWNTIYPNHWLRKTSRDYVIRLFNKLSMLDEWINVPKARQLLADHLAGRQHAYQLIGALITAILFLESTME